MKCSVWCTVLAVLCCKMAVYAQPPVRYSLIISEIMADPSPAIGLPDAEYIELFNTSSNAVALNGCKISDGTSTATIGQTFVLAANSFVIICSNSAVNQFSVYGATLGVSNFPSLNNEKDTLRLLSKEGITLHAVAYQKSWYQNVLKQEGGWSLEIKTPAQACISEGNWAASNALIGGTPGTENSQHHPGITFTEMELLKAFAPGNQSIQLYFNHALDSLDASDISKFVLNPGNIVPVNARCLAPLFNSIVLEFSQPLSTDLIYTISAKNVKQCLAGTTGETHTKVAIAAVPGYRDLIVNEVLFNPVPGNTDYIECYNRSNKCFNAKELYITSKAANGNLGVPKPISEENTLLFPGEYYLITEDKNSVAKLYLLKYPAHCFDMNELPSLPDDKGNMVMLNKQGEMVDALSYEDNWQFALLNNQEGVALERIDVNDSTQKKENWHSASTSAGYGTPTYENSQRRVGQLSTENFVLQPSIFSPDNDGTDDLLFINYIFEQPGNVCTITVFDMSGRPVKVLVRNALCGNKGWFKWDGLNEQWLPLPTGIYILVVEVFNKNGDTQKIKKSVTLARKK